jgi:hypothetical protein
LQSGIPTDGKNLRASRKMKFCWFTQGAPPFFTIVGAPSKSSLGWGNEDEEQVQS